MRLSRYLLRLFSIEAMALFGIAAFLLFLIQCLRLFDVVATRGQSLWTLLGQALLGMPSLGIVFLYVCIGIGLGRALRSLQDRSELQIIHVSALVPSLMRAIAGYALGGAAALLLLTHVIEPLANRSITNWSASIAADLVSRSMVPHRFTEIADGVSLVIGSRDSEGRIVDFFADDSRGEPRRTYFAKSAIITRDEQGFVLRMQDGAMQQMTSEGRFSEISFARYDLELSSLTGQDGSGTSLDSTPSYEFFAQPVGEGEMRSLQRRTAEAMRVMAICLFVAALAAFPSGKRRRAGLPIELSVLGAAFFERSLTTFLPGPMALSGAGGSMVLAALSLLVLLVRLRPRSPLRLRRAVA
ncbi:MAG: LptF/LptG family permease [Hyphomicrobiales bacterium]|nr:MAG: LptF/LptG family permease [Hyphomicrobiales bacterium]